MKSNSPPEKAAFPLTTFSLIRGGLGAMVGILALIFMLHEVDLQAVWVVLKSAHWGFVGLGLASVGMNYFSKVFRWRVLLGESAPKTSFISLMAAVLLGQLLNFLVPGRFGDFARALIVGGKTGRAFTLGTVALEKGVETLAFALLILSLLLWMPLPSWLEISPWFLILVVGTGCVMLAGAVHYSENISAVFVRAAGYIPSRISQRILSPLQTGFGSIRVLGERKNLFQILWLTGVVWGTALFNNYIGMRALGIELPFSVAVLLLIGLQIGIVVAASPAGMGIFEAICVYTLVFFGVDRTVALGFGILLHALVLVPQIVGGIWALAWWGFRLSPA